MSTERFENILPPEYAAQLKVLSIGVGAIGSANNVNLAKLGVSDFVMLDPDKVEAANVGVQAFDYTHLDVAKVDAMAELLVINSPHAQVRVNPIVDLGVDEDGNPNPEPLEKYGRKVSIAAIAKKFEQPEQLHEHNPNVVVSGVDDPEVRLQILDTLLNWDHAGVHDAKPRLYIDGRMGAHTAEIWGVLWGNHKCATIKDIEQNYRISLSGEFNAAPCGEVALPPTASTCGALMATMIRAYAMGEPLCRWASIDLKHMTLITDGMITDYL